MSRNNYLWVLVSVTALELLCVQAQPTCSPVTFNSYPGDGFSYVVSIAVPPGCQSSQFNVSRLVAENSIQSCNAFFNQANSSSLVRSPPDGKFDSGSVCGRWNYANVYVQTTCNSSLLDSQLIMIARTNASCANTSIASTKTQYYYYNGYSSYRSSTLSTGARIGIAVGCFILVLVIILIYYAYRSSIKNSAQATPAINMQPQYPQQPNGHPVQQPVQGYPVTPEGYPASYPPHQESNPPGYPHPPAGYPHPPAGYPQPPAGYPHSYPPKEQV